VDLTTLTVQQLSEVKKQLDEGQSPSGQLEESNFQSSSTFHSRFHIYGKRETSLRIVSNQLTTAAKKKTKVGPMPTDFNAVKGSRSSSL
jgi:hypothetical protein